MEYRRTSHPRITDRPGAAPAPRRAAAVPGPARSPEPRPRTPEPRAGGPARSASRLAPRPALRPPFRPVPGPVGFRTPHRLTAVGSGVVTLGGTFLGGAGDYWLFGGSGYLLGLTYIVVCFQVAVRVRPIDLAAAPISGPIAFAITLLVLGRSGFDGLSGQIIGLATSLALQAGWLFAGTGVSAAIVLARHFALSRARRRTVS